MESAEVSSLSATVGEPKCVYQFRLCGPTVPNRLTEECTLLPKGSLQRLLVKNQIIQDDDCIDYSTALDSLSA